MAGHSAGTSAGKRWIAETLFDALGFRMTFAADRVLYEMETEHQHLVLFEQPFFGKMLMLDGATQISKRDEYIYQEMMAHVPLFAHGHAQDVLIVGGGDCGIAEEVLKHRSVKRLTQVEIDPKVIAFAKEHFPEFARPVFADARFESVIDDGARYVARTDRRFDAIIVDSTDPIGPGKVLFGAKFYAGCRRCLKKGGVLVTQNGVPFFQKNAHGEHDEAAQALCRRGLLCGRHSGLCRRPYGDRLCQRQQAPAPAAGLNDRCALPRGRQLPDKILVAGTSRRRILAAALHRRPGNAEEEEIAAADGGGLDPTADIIVNSALAGRRLG